MADLELISNEDLGDGRCRVKAHVKGVNEADMLEGSIKVAQTVTDMYLRKNKPCSILIERDAEAITVTINESADS